MSDLLDRQKVLDTLEVADTFLDDERARTVEIYKALLRECIKVLPSGSENIRCKDCKFLKVAGDDIFKEHMCGNAESWVVATDLYFGCVLAERAEE